MHVTVPSFGRTYLEFDDKSQGLPNPSTLLFRGLPPSITESQLRDEVSEFGKLKSITFAQGHLKESHPRFLCSLAFSGDPIVAGNNARKAILKLSKTYDKSNTRIDLDRDGIFFLYLHHD